MCVHACVLNFFKCFGSFIHPSMPALMVRSDAQLVIRRLSFQSQQHSFVEINDEIFSTVYGHSPHLLIQEGHFSASGEKMWTSTG